MNAELIKALRCCISDNADDCDLCPYQSDCKSNGTGQGKMIRDAADALEAADKRIDGLQKLVDINTERCEALRKQLRESHENYEKHLNELEARLPKQDRGICMTAIGTLYVPNYDDER